MNRASNETLSPDQTIICRPVSSGGGLAVVDAESDIQLFVLNLPEAATTVSVDFNPMHYHALALCPSNYYTFVRIHLYLSLVGREAVVMVGCVVGYCVVGCL